MMEETMTQASGNSRSRQGLMPMKGRIVQVLFDRYARWRLPELVAPAQAILLDYPVSPEPRYGYGKPPHQKIYEILDRNRDYYSRRLTEFLSLSDLIEQILTDDAAVDSGVKPSFQNPFFNKLDAIALMGLLRELRPRLLLEVGSGNSTRFARRAVEHFRLPTRIVSCDPTPRAELRGVSDEIIAAPAETLPLSVFEQLEAGDILFIDGSHRVFQNSDVTALFMDVLPILKEGVVLHVHDIFLPYDYPPSWKDRFYSEQYLLAAMMMANPDRFAVLMANAFVSHEPDLTAILEPIWAIPGMAEARDRDNEYGLLGGSIWLRLRSQN
jgi:hypothetical protein